MAFQIGNRYYHEDIESGEIIEISKQTYEALGDMVKRVKSMIGQSQENIGMIQLHSTMGDDPNIGHFMSLWKEWKSNNEP